MPRKPTSAVGSSRTIPSSMPSPARRIGTTSGSGAASRTPWAAPPGGDLDRLDPTSRVASYASRVTSSSASRRKVGESVLLVAQRGELVGDQRVVDDKGVHDR